MSLSSARPIQSPGSQPTSLKSILILSSHLHLGLPKGPPQFKIPNYIRGQRVIGISRSLIWWKTQMELILNPYGKFQWSLEGPVSQIHSPHLHVGAPGIFSDLLWSVQMLKIELGAESNGKLMHLLIPSKIATVCSWRPALGQNTLMLMMMMILMPLA